MPSSVTASSFAKIFTPLKSNTSTDEPMSLRYWRIFLSSEPIPADATVNEKSSTSRSNSASMVRLSSAQRSMVTWVSLSIKSSTSFIGEHLQLTVNRSVPDSSLSAIANIFSQSIIVDLKIFDSRYEIRGLTRPLTPFIHDAKIVKKNYIPNI